MIKNTNPKFSFYDLPYKGISSYFEMIDFAEKYNVPAIEFMKYLELSTPDKEMAKRLREYADEKGIFIPCFSMYIELMGGNHKENMKVLKDYAEVAAILGSPYLHHTVVTDQNIQNIVPRTHELIKKASECIREIYDYAESFGVKAVYEDQALVLNGVENFSEFLDTVDRNVGVVADFGNIYQSTDSAVDFVKAFADRVVHVHFKDMVFTEKPETKKGLISLTGKYLKEVAPGKGIVDFDTCMKMLSDVGYDGYYSLEWGVESADSPELDEVMMFINNMNQKRTVK